MIKEYELREDLDAIADLLHRYNSNPSTWLSWITYLLSRLDDKAMDVDPANQRRYEEMLSSLFFLDEPEKILEVISNSDLGPDGVLYDLPNEAFPQNRDTFKLTTHKELVEKAIEDARKKKNVWPKFQLLYDLHPIARWMQFKLLAKIDKGNALVARLRDPVPEKSVWFVFQGISSNGQGKPILSRSFVIGRSFEGGDMGSLESFSEFVTAYNLDDSLQTLEITNKHTDIIQGLLVEAVQ